ncbi:hypothetical protein N7461_009607 [Penicillium sp. DV-2018c]|nr:hypothetical protein N7461_009607 [Penicillium sp. DV-2018c]
MFFRPYPERVLQIYPFDTSAVETLPELYLQPDFASILAKVLLEYPDAEDPLEVARTTYEEQAWVRSPDEWETRAQETEYYISMVHEAPRKGRPVLSSLFDLGSLKRPL